MQRGFVTSPGPRPILVTDTITIIEPGDVGSVVVSGSHGGVSSAQFVLGHALAGVVYNDAGVGRHGAGIAALAILDEVRLPALATDHQSAIIGDGNDTWRAGIVSHANAAAAAAGVRPGLPVQTAAAMLSHGAIVQTAGMPPRLNRSQRRVGDVDLMLLDSISMLRADGRGAVVISGSHGGAVSADFALRHRPALTVFNDAGIGKQDAGCAALELLARDGLAAVAIDCHSGRIGDPADMLEHGVISRSNDGAAELGLLPGRSLHDAIVVAGSRFTNGRSN